MNASYGKLLNKPIKQISEENGWSIWFCYNDKCKDHRRLSYARNGWRIPERSKRAIKKSVEALLKEHRVKGEVYWIESLHYGYGIYDKLCIEIPY